MYRRYNIAIVITKSLNLFKSLSAILTLGSVTNCPLPTFAGSHVVMTSMTSVEVICNSSSQKSKLDCVEGGWSGVVASCQQLAVVSKKDESASSADMWSTITNEWKSPKGLTLVICLGVLLGIAVGMIMLSFAICLIKQKPRCLAETAQQIGEIELYEESANQIFCPLRFNVPTATSAAMQSHPHQQFNNSTTIYAQPKHDVYDSQQKTYPSLINGQQQQFTEQQHPQQPTFSFQTNSTISESVATKPQKMTFYIANKTKACSSIIASKSEICDLHFNKFCPDLVRCRDYQSVSYADRNLASVYDSTTLNSTNNQSTDH
ncbi:hypothetical protein HELRODRAFT_194410 [Helobdella robusta]|uniref:Uncharacterized protein n=1 Tax=Helobdella robusta TaxID=6412 RepID=T1FW10_HELRO|nr:hypothetical protein HELRODRAFT_194410 [Helobdella robusta]ESN92016.1 hypothetical protein HELRODRAFT_194410 [Helobdella robusta]